jgi:hypothetical protein
LETATAAVKQAISVVGEVLQKLSYISEVPDFCGGSLYDYYNDCDDQLLEDTDSAYFGSTPEEQATDDRDLADLEANFQVRGSFSPRMKALALRTLARDLIFVALGLSEKELASALSRFALDKSGAIDLAGTYEHYVPHFPID